MLVAMMWRFLDNSLLLAFKFRSYTSVTSQQKITLLNHRSLLRVSGRDSLKLLQGLITNDMELLRNRGDVIYAMLLNAQGRSLYDVLVYKTQIDHEFLLECDRGSADELVALLKRYKLRSKVKFDHEQKFKIYAAFGDAVTSANMSVSPECLSCQDPRLPELGSRLLCSSNDVDFMVNSSVEDYVDHRYKLGVSEGVDEISNCIPLEHNLALLNGVSFTKGCYVGQELVARVHHTGVIRKRIMPLHLPADHGVQSGETIQNDKGKRIGKVVGVQRSLGIGLLRIADALNQNGKFHISNTTPVTIGRPSWWPTNVE